MSYLNVFGDLAPMWWCSSRGRLCSSRWRFHSSLPFPRYRSRFLREVSTGLRQFFKVVGAFIKKNALVGVFSGHCESSVDSSIPAV